MTALRKDQYHSLLDQATDWRLQGLKDDEDISTSLSQGGNTTVYQGRLPIQGFSTDITLERHMEWYDSLDDDKTDTETSYISRILCYDPFLGEIEIALLKSEREQSVLKSHFDKIAAQLGSKRTSEGSVRRKVLEKLRELPIKK